MILLLFTYTQLAILSIFCAIFYKYLQNRAKNRKFDEMTKNINGPKCYPIIGNGHLFRGSNEDILNSLMELANTYESPIKISLGKLPFFIVTKPEHIEVMLNHPMALSKIYFYKFVKPVVGKGLFSAPAKIWKKNRKIIAPTFNQKILNDFVTIFSEKSSILVNILDKHLNKMLDIKHFISKFTIDVVGKTSMGIELNDQTIGSAISEHIDNICEICFNRMFQLWYHPDFIFENTTIGKKFYKHLRAFHEFINQVITNRKQEIRNNNKLSTYDPELIETHDKKYSTFLDLLLKLNEDESILSNEQLFDEVTTFLIAGSDTTSAALSFVILMLGMHPELQEQLYEDVLDVVGPSRDIEYDDLPKFKSIKRFLLESNRLFPVAPIISRNTVGEIDLGDNYILPSPSGIIAFIFYVHRSEKYWKEPLKFNPDRFLEEEIEKRHPYSYIPFSAGARSCIGKKYALMMMKVATANLLRNFKITTPYKTIEEIRLQQSIVIQAIDGFNVKLERRN